MPSGLDDLYLETLIMARFASKSNRIERQFNFSSHALELNCVDSI